jgi:hypothetical protein
MPIALPIKARNILGITTGFREESGGRWRTNELCNSGTENRGKFCYRTRQRRRSQDRRQHSRRRTKPGVSRSANRASMVRDSRVLGMGVGRLQGPHHTHQRDAEHAHCSDEYAPLCQYLQHAIPNLPARVLRLHNFTVRCHRRKRGAGKIIRRRTPSGSWPSGGLSLQHRS